MSDNCDWSNITNDGKTADGCKVGKRRLIVCSDGTWLGSDKADVKEKSNVARLSQLILPSHIRDDGSEVPQIMYYQAGASIAFM
jgi:uncharacterized protein (DUF2235 family)